MAELFLAFLLETMSTIFFSLLAVLGTVTALNNCNKETDKYMTSKLWTAPTVHVCSNYIKLKTVYTILSLTLRRFNKSENVLSYNT